MLVSAREKRSSGSFIPGKVLYVPKLDTSQPAHPRMDMLRVYDQPDLDSFPAGLWGIREPPREKDGERRSNGNNSPHCHLCPPP